ncbi:MAG TPA: M43 family zinc metalloprotease [Phnomibacter sp.]|nr:M43 family zinc metalloprotease [Phnomibacter sp.]
MRKLYLILLALLPISMFAQVAPCGFDNAHTKAMLDNPTFRDQVLQNDKQIQQIIQSGKIQKLKPQGVGTALYIIPVVVHVMHTGGAVGSIYNPTDAQITGAIDYLNQVWDGTAPGFSGGAGDMQIQFVLAKRDPNCNPTNGIVRVDASGVIGYNESGVSVPGSGGSGASEITIKNLSRWNTSQYYNIWVVNRLNGADGTSGQFTAGYAYFPGASATVDGTVMLATQMQAGDKTMPHEIGHALNLHHPFNGSSAANMCPANTDCTAEGDRVCDTDPVSQNVTGGVYDFNCRSGLNNCTGTDYSPYTESNVMGYTNCFTLFTPGQKTRALAAMSLASRASLATSPGAKLPGEVPVCPPKINFVSATTSAPENGLTVVDCRSYRDYSISMNIATPPSANANVQLGLAGTATSGTDYILSTNGNFTTPSTTLVFPAGSTANQSFVIRVFDDAAIEGNETIQLSFNVTNDPGGNALKGEGIPNTTITINDNDAAPVFEVPVSAVVGSYTTNLTSSPFRGSQAANRTQTLYLASELTALGLQAGRVVSLSIFVTQKNSTNPFTDFTVKLKNVSNTTLSSIPIAATVPVFGPVNYSTVLGENKFTLTNNFVWDGVSNLVVDICYSGAVAAGADDRIQGTAGISGRLRLANTGDVDGCGATSLPLAYGGGGARDALGLTIAYPGPTTETILNATATNYLGPNQDVAFKSASGKLLARVKNLTAHDYGCTEVTVDRAGSGAKAFLNGNTGNFVADKTLRIVPTTNNPAGQYEITLYYTAAEVSGWKAATGLSWASSQIIKTQNAISTYPQGTAPGNAITETVSGSKDFYGLDSTITASFTTGFSGFAIGVPGTPLPVTWLGISASLVQGGVGVNWSTASENNTNFFEVEVSADGTNFTAVGKVAAKGNSTTRSDYSFMHSKPQGGILYYRVRQVDKDGKFTYSAVAQVELIAANAKPFVYPSPARSTLMLNFGQMANGARWEILSADMKLTGKAGKGANAAQQQIDISSLPAGLYFIRVSNSKNVEVLRFVKQ